jgi:hypothetical protein
MEYQWLRNGEPIPGAIWPTLKAEYVRKGDFIAVTVRAKQPGGNGDKQTSDTVIIGNTQPVATFSGVEPGTPTSAEKLKALGVGYDHDSDNLTFVYQWMVNGEPVVGQEEQFLATSHFRRGDRVQIAVTPYDGEEFGMTLRSAPIVVGNSPPEIISDPPTHTEDGTFRYAVQTVDVDGDSVKFSLEGERPAGLEIDPATGLIQWKPVMPKSEVAYVFRVVAEDPEGAKSVQQITLNYKPLSFSGCCSGNPGMIIEVESNGRWLVEHSDRKAIQDECNDCQWKRVGLHHNGTGCGSSYHGYPGGCNSSYRDSLAAQLLFEKCSYGYLWQHAICQNRGCSP